MCTPHGNMFLHDLCYFQHLSKIYKTYKGYRTHELTTHMTHVSYVLQIQIANVFGQDKKIIRRWGYFVKKNSFHVFVTFYVISNIF